MVMPRNVHSLTDFQRNAKKYLRNLKKARHGTLLTVNGRGAAVLLDPSVYEHLLARAWKDEEAAAIQMGILEMEAGLGRPFEDVARDLRARSRRLARNASRRSA